MKGMHLKGMHYETYSLKGMHFQPVETQALSTRGQHAVVFNLHLRAPPYRVVLPKLLRDALPPLRVGGGHSEGGGDDGGQVLTRAGANTLQVRDLRMGLGIISQYHITSFYISERLVGSHRKRESVFSFRDSSNQ